MTAMELIDRYLQSVKSALPKRQQADVVRELTDEVLSRVEEKEDALGRPLTEDEQVALLKQLGHPWLLASRYRKQRYLIDPSIFTLYWIVLRLILIVTFFGMAIGAVSLAASGQGLGAALNILFQYPMAAIKVFAFVTLVFVVLDIVQAKVNFFEKWDPRSLPKLTKSAKCVSTRESIAGMVAAAVFGVWWLVALKHQFWLFGPAANFIQLGPVFQTLFPLYVLMVVVDIVRHGIALARPDWDRGRFAFRIFHRGTTLAILCFLLRAQDLLVPGPSADGNMATALAGANRGIHIGLTVTTVIVAAQFLWDLYTTLFRGGDTQEVASL
jgi:hypothetical protein